MKCDTSQSSSWDYLIVTASNALQAESYRKQLMLRQNLGGLFAVRTVLVIPDPEGMRVGSGGATLHCLLTVLNAEQCRTGQRYDKRQDWENALNNLRILIIHAGGDSKRLPPYGPCGKIFIPIPGDSDHVLGQTLLDRQLPLYLSLPHKKNGGQLIITTGDVFLDFDPCALTFSQSGITAVGCDADIPVKQNHGVFSCESSGRVKRYFQKPSRQQLRKERALDKDNQSILDIGIMSLDEKVSAALVALCEPVLDAEGKLVWSGKVAEAIESFGLDFFLEICCAFGTESNYIDYAHILKTQGSKWPQELREPLFLNLNPIAFQVERLQRCEFLHFGTLHQLIQSGHDLTNLNASSSQDTSLIEINNQITTKGKISGSQAWLEGCRIDARLDLGGMNVLIGVDIEEDLTLPEGLCLDVLEGRNREGRRVWFVRPLGVFDLFNDSLEKKGTFCNLSILEWISQMETTPEQLWPKPDESSKTIWEGRFFPAVDRPGDYRKWLWMYQPGQASKEQRQTWESADRFSLAEIAILTDQNAFHVRRQENRFEWIHKNLQHIFSSGSGFSAQELAYALSSGGTDSCQTWCLDILRYSFLRFGSVKTMPSIERLELSRIFHSLGSALQYFIQTESVKDKDPPRLSLNVLTSDESQWLSNFHISVDKDIEAEEFARIIKLAAFEHMGKLIIRSKKGKKKFPENALKDDEIIWGRAPARLDLAGGWSDTPPYSLERGGAVLNVAVDLNSQPPIHVYVRTINQPEIRISSLDFGSRLNVRSLDELTNYKDPTSQFGLAKAALVLSGFSPETSFWPEGVHSLESMLTAFGGGLDITTLAAIPGGSGLGTSSIMGAVLLAVFGRLTGKDFLPRELFHLVLQLEQELTTGGGWQDQIGGVVKGVKVIRSLPGMIPDPQIQFLPPDVLDPSKNEGLSLLFYTGLTRLAKNILGSVVGRYLDRERSALDVLNTIHHFPSIMAESMAAKNTAEFGGLLNTAWNLKKAIDPHSTTEGIELILERIRPHIYGATLLGAGAGGFLLMICRSKQDVSRVKKELTDNPPNERSRFFDFKISSEGLLLDVC